MKNNIKAAANNILLMVLTVLAAIAIGSQVPKLVGQVRGNVKTGDYTVHVANQPQRLTLYGTTTCPHCLRARQFLRRSGIQFNDVIIDASPQSQMMFALLKEDGVPVLVSRNSLISGFSAAAYDELAKADATL